MYALNCTIILLIFFFSKWLEYLTKPPRMDKVPYKFVKNTSFGNFLRESFVTLTNFIIKKNLGRSIPLSTLNNQGYR